MTSILHAGWWVTPTAGSGGSFEVLSVDTSIVSLAVRVHYGPRPKCPVEKTKTKHDLNVMLAAANRTTAVQLIEALKRLVGFGNIAVDKVQN
ncbi:hypothetical protein KIN20_020896 [Parelaphostrongylus tenuis]|uniref:Uncharacterized protein n=1 Tax=Parelaphostrongylus tenuis TaxID=148309 RepID=A0AAD5NAB2_PARTN|nr:hypothetical protein KIN20_020896 [Parelaphostrongylus tenuis]